MEFLKWMFLEVLSDSITWIAILAIGFCWTLGVLDYLKERKEARQ